MMTPISIKTKTQISKSLSKEILAQLDKAELKDLDDADVKKVIKNYLLSNFTEQLATEVKKATTDIESLKEIWLSTLNSESTKRNYNHNVNEFLNWLNGKNIIEVKAMDADNYYIYLKNTKYRDGTIRFKIASVSSFFSFLVRHDVVSRNYFHNIKLPARQIKKKRNEEIPSGIDVKIIEDELRKGLKATGRGAIRRINASKVLLIAISLMKTTAVRVGSLPVMHIDRNGTYSAKSKGNIQTGKVPTETIELIQELGFDTRTPLKGVKICTIKKYFEIVCTRLYKQEKIKKVYSPHSLKHYSAVNFWNNCKDIYRLKEFLHHKSIATSQVYLNSLNIE